MQARRQKDVMNYAALAKRKSDVSMLHSNAPPNSASGGLRIGESNDSYEVEANRVADEILAGGATKHHWSLASRGGPMSLQRQCSCGASSGPEGQCEEWG